MASVESTPPLIRNKLYSCIFFKKRFILKLCICVFVYQYVHLRIDARGGQKSAGSPGAELHAVMSHLTGVLGTELWSFVRAVYILFL